MSPFSLSHCYPTSKLGFIVILQMAKEKCAGFSPGQHHAKHLLGCAGASKTLKGELLQANALAECQRRTLDEIVERFGDGQTGGNSRKQEQHRLDRTPVISEASNAECDQRPADHHGSGSGTRWNTMR
jgi:hypothetical protein